MNVDTAIRIFASVLNSTWNIVTPLLVNRQYTSDSSSTSDWLQANWELLVERKVLPLNEYFEVYGEGADFYGTSSRITDIQAVPGFSIAIVVSNAPDLLTGLNVVNSRFCFDKLVGFANGYYVDSPPFNFVLTHDESKGIERVFSIGDVSFECQRIQG